MRVGGTVKTVPCGIAGRLAVPRLLFDYSTENLKSIQKFPELSGGAKTSERPGKIPRPTAYFMYADQQQPQSFPPQPQLPPQLLPQPLPLPPQITITMIRMMIHHQLFPKAQIPELLQDIRSTSLSHFGAVTAHSMLCREAGSVRAMRQGVSEPRQAQVFSFQVSGFRFQVSGFRFQKCRERS